MIQPEENNLPEGWAAATLSELVRPSTEKVEPRTCPDAPYLSLEHLESNTNRIIGHGSASEVTSTKSVFRPGDVLYGKLRPYLNKVAIPDRHGVCSTDILVFRPPAGLNAHWLMWFLSLPDVVQYATDHQRGLNLPRVSFGDLGSLILPLPPLAEQERIVAKVEALLARVRSVRQRLDAVPGILKHFRQAVLAHACSGKLTEDWRDANEPGAEWRTTRLGELGDVKGGITKNAQRKSLPLQMPYLRVANVYTNKLDLSEVKKIGVTPAEFERTALNPDDLLFVEGNGSVDQIGRVALWNGAIGECVHQNHLIRFVAGDGILPRFALYMMMSPIGRERLMANAISTAGLHSLSISKIAAVELDVPSLLEQREIIRRVEALLSLADSIEQRVAAAMKRAEALAQSILARAFRGELVPTEAELAAAEGRDYETAEQLLARIRDESPSTAGVKQERKRRRTRAETQTIMRGEAILAILLLLDAWKKPVHRRWLDAGVILVLNADVRAALLKKSTPKRRGRRSASEVRYQPALDIILNNLADADAVVITQTGGRQAIGLSAGFDRAQLDRATDDDRAAAREAIKVLEKLNERDAMSILQEMSRDVELELVS